LEVSLTESIFDDQNRPSVETHDEEKAQWIDPDQPWKCLHQLVKQQISRSEALTHEIILKRFEKVLKTLDQEKLK
jgi:hypothetical protein